MVKTVATTTLARIKVWSFVVASGFSATGGGFSKSVAINVALMSGVIEGEGSKASSVEIGRVGKGSGVEIVGDGVIVGIRVRVFVGVREKKLIVAEISGVGVGNIRPDVPTGVPATCPWDGTKAFVHSPQFSIGW